MVIRRSSRGPGCIPTPRGTHAGRTNHAADWYTLCAEVQQASRHELGLDLPDWRPAWDPRQDIGIFRRWRDEGDSDPDRWDELLKEVSKSLITMFSTQKIRPAVEEFLQQTFGATASVHAAAQGAATDSESEDSLQQPPPLTPPATAPTISTIEQQSPEDSQSSSTQPAVRGAGGHGVCQQAAVLRPGLQRKQLSSL